jgi:hypothetical protein
LVVIRVRQIDPLDAGERSDYLLRSADPIAHPPEE